MHVVQRIWLFLLTTFIPMLDIIILTWSLFFGISNRFNLSFDEKEVEDDDSEVDSDEGCRPQFSDIKKVSGFLDKELEASGFTRKDQDDMEKVQLLVFPLSNIS